MYHSGQHRFGLVTTPLITNPSSSKLPKSSSAPFVGEALRSLNVSQETKELISASWRGPTQKQYNTPINRWKHYCSSRDINYLTPTIEQVLEFLTEIYNTGAGHSVVSTTRSALSSVIFIPGFSRLSDHPLIKRLMKGVFNNRPPCSKYTKVWNVDSLFIYLKTLPINSNLTLKMLTLKLVILLGILSGQRVSTIHKFDILKIDIFNDQVIFHVTELLKHTRVGKPNQPFIYKAFPADPNLCVLTCLKEYLSRRLEPSQLQ